jgi:NTP pyrophosphatase (non-canonical NTP hydrolase)
MEAGRGEGEVTIDEFQRHIEEIYLRRDSERGLGGTFMWFVEEVGELSTALREGGQKDREEEFADCLAWLMTLASISGVRMEKAIEKYGRGCPGCGHTPCGCPETKP